ncbi:MAG: cytochrome c biogenesis protein ResB [Oribacterium sp.]|nr:cytochrome c biogenesis protein ResB [Oribacterium sp.]
MNGLKKIYRYISSMKLALVLLGLLIIGCVIGSVIPQGQVMKLYQQQYGDRTAGLIMALNLDDVFHSWWFVTFTIFLSLNLLTCSVLRTPALIRRWKDYENLPDEKEASGKTSVENNPNFIGRLAKNPEEFLKSLGISKFSKTNKGVIVGWRHKAGLLGPLITHIGVLLLILGFSLGQMTKVEYTVYGLPGDAKQIGDTDYVLEINAFDIGLRADDTVEQYTSDITVRNVATGEKESGTVTVNAPASMFGMKFFQNSTGWAADMHILKNGELLQEEALEAGNYVTVSDKTDLQIGFMAFYPDYHFDREKGPMTLSSKLNNPAYLYMVYFQGSVLGMNTLMEGEELTIDEYTVTFDNPRNYTLIQIKKDNFTYFALLGGVVLLLGLFLSLYVQPEKLWLEPEGDGYVVYGSCGKSGLLFTERVKAKLKEINT